MGFVSVVAVAGFLLLCLKPPTAIRIGSDDSKLDSKGSKRLKSIEISRESSALTKLS
jgi:hypothetical protein